MLLTAEVAGVTPLVVCVVCAPTPKISLMLSPSVMVLSPAAAVVAVAAPPLCKETKERF